jgi:hypothetical protein
MTTLQIPVDDRWLLRAGMTVNELAGELRDFLAAKLDESGRRTLGQAAEMAGQLVWSFMETISRMGVSVINMDLDMLKHDLAAACASHHLRCPPAHPAGENRSGRSGIQTRSSSVDPRCRLAGEEPRMQKIASKLFLIILLASKGKPVVSRPPFPTCADHLIVQNSSMGPLLTGTT